MAKAKTAAQRQKECRERKAARLEALKLEPIKFEIGRGTRKALDSIKPDDMSDAEFLSAMIHAIASPDDSHMQKLCNVTVTVKN